MRDASSKPVFRNMGIGFDPPDAGTAARAKRVIRTYRCNLTGAVKQVTRAVFTSQGRDKDGKPTTVVRTTPVDRKPLRPTDSLGFHTKEEKRAEAAERDAHWRSLSLTDQVAALDKRLGVGIGATKQRANLAAAIAAQAVAAKNPKAAGPKGGVNQKHTTDEKVAKQIAHAQGVVETRKPKKSNKQ